jgi:hypothetical protein
MDTRLEVAPNLSPAMENAGIVAPVGEYILALTGKLNFATSKANPENTYVKVGIRFTGDDALRSGINQIVMFSGTFIDKKTGEVKTYGDRWAAFLQCLGLTPEEIRGSRLEIKDVETGEATLLVNGSPVNLGGALIKGQVKVKQFDRKDGTLGEGNEVHYFKRDKAVTASNRDSHFATIG